MGILHLGERQRVRLFVRRDTFDRFLSCLVFVPRDRFNTENRRRIEGDPARARPARTSIDYTTRVSESVLVRLHYLAYVEPGTRARASTSARSRRCWWPPPARGATTSRRRCSRSTARSAARRSTAATATRFPTAYRADWVPRSAVADIGRIEELDRAGRPLAAPLPPARGAAGRAAREGLPRRRRRSRCPTCCRCSRTWAWRWPTSGPTRSRRATASASGSTTSASPTRARTSSRPTRVARRLPGRLHPRLARRDRERRLQPAGAARRPHLARDDRAARDRPLPAPGRHDLQRPLRGAGARRRTRRWRALLVDLFLRPLRPRGGRPRARPSSSASASRRRSTRSRASTRTASCAASSAWCGRCCAPTSSSATADGARKPYLSFKLDPAQLPWLPLPRPRFEIFVYSPRIEGVHLRGGKVARGGIRWSDRREDFRTEVLGLMKAQMVKNAVIVPVGRQGRLRGQAPAAGRRPRRRCWPRSRPATGPSSAACST